MAVLTSGVLDPDILFLSSTDLHSWTSINLPYRDMSLTTYKSKFVLVGGRHPSTREPTNQLLTITTGRQWEALLPPMPTKRYYTSSVSIRSPEILVVAGGQGSNNDDLDVVEALLGDKWLTVDSLPTPASWLSSTHHDGELCFMEHGSQSSTVFTCSCISLISSSSKSSGSNSSTDRPLWQQIEAPGGWGSTILSCFSRLIFVDDRGRVRGYSSVARSWQKATGTEPTANKIGLTAATVHTTGDLIFAHEKSGVYRGAVSGKALNFF